MDQLQSKFRIAELPSDPDDRHFVTALARGLDLLACFRRGEGSLANGDFAQRSGLPRSTVSRLTRTLTRTGHLHLDAEQGRYQPGPALIALASTILGGLELKEIARPGMRALAAYSGASVGLGVRDRLSMRYIACETDEAHAAAMNMGVGSRLSIARSSMGRAYLAVCDEAERHDIVEELHVVDPEGWAAIGPGVQAAIEDHHRDGCCRSFGDWQPGVNAIAVGFRTAPGMPVMALSCGAPAELLSPVRLLDDIRPRLIALAHSLCAGK
ncbi:DNA-binding IclR family transcriptional regulator [Endobacter medicaginis]|uniref:IclR family transcriptional regulator n=1 Tax=Endobacter medicaginis TaxID=1181271 RepID=A0A839UVQ1_9PROT|nr:IclR family transcriptional regulator [Endobacter medicaginis]MBB3172463.1 DNA-binding IclR family transcriptional regulator [Endobacter medicaginis]MCX5474048.1 IclR family transcriptional regulator [Endobacter medicaginis]NVN31500.1 IclR family transcriptional regulator [Endobacter medicaginis]